MIQKNLPGTTPDFFSTDHLRALMDEDNLAMFAMMHKEAVARMNAGDNTHVTFDLHGQVHRIGPNSTLAAIAGDIAYGWIKAHAAVQENLPVSVRHDVELGYAPTVEGDQHIHPGYPDVTRFAFACQQATDLVHAAALAEEKFLAMCKDPQVGDVRRVVHASLGDAINLFLS